MKCPICSKPQIKSSTIDALSSPFCSKRCADIDLYNWLSGNYSIAVQEYDYDMNEDFEEIDLESKNINIEKYNN